jgi:hypothetical protein
MPMPDDNKVRSLFITALPLQRDRDDELAMASWLDANIAGLQKYLSLREAGKPAKK